MSENVSTMTKRFETEGRPALPGRTAAEVLPALAESGKLNAYVFAFFVMAVICGQALMLLLLAAAGIGVCLLSATKTMCPLSPAEEHTGTLWKLGTMFATAGVTGLFWMIMSRFLRPESIRAGLTGADAGEQDEQRRFLMISGVVALFLLLFVLVGFDIKIG